MKMLKRQNPPKNSPFPHKDRGPSDPGSPAPVAPIAHDADSLFLRIVWTWGKIDPQEPPEEGEEVE